MKIFFFPFFLNIWLVVDVMFLFLCLMLPREKDDFTHPDKPQIGITYDYGNSNLSHTVDLCVTLPPNPA